MNKDATRDGDRPDLSAVITCYYEEATIDEFHARLREALGSTPYSFEIILVNDGSTDATYERLESIFEKDERVSAVLDLFRNAGQGSAMMAGICEARGDAFLFLDSDLQLHPEDAPRLLAAYFEEDFDVVTGFRAQRRDSFFRKLPSLLANVIMRRIAKHDLRDFGCTFKVFDAKLVRAFDPGPTRTFRPADVMAKAGRIKEIEVAHEARKHGKSGWTFRKLWAYNMDNLVALSERPFQYLAVLALLGAVVFFLRIVLGYVSDFRVLPSISNGLILNVLMGGMLFLLAVLSLMGEFVVRSFSTLRETPRYVVRDARRRDRTGDGDEGSET